MNKNDFNISTHNILALMDSVHEDSSTEKGLRPFSTTAATVALAKLDETGIISHPLQRRGYILMTLGGSADANASVRKVLSLIVPHVVQTRAALFLSNEVYVRSFISKCFGTADKASAKTNDYAEVNDLDIAEAIKNAIDTAPESVQDMEEPEIGLLRRLLFTVLADVLSQSGHYKTSRSITYFANALELKTELIDPFTSAIVKDVLQQSAFAEIAHDAAVVSTLSDRYTPLTRFSSYISKMGNSMVREIMVLNDIADRKFRGAALLGEILHNRINVPQRLLQDPMLVQLRSNINFHNLTLTREANDNWYDGWKNSFGSLRAWINTMNDIAQEEEEGVEEKDKAKIAMQSNVDLEMLSDVTPLLKDAAASFEAFIEFAPLSYYQGASSLDIIDALDSNDNIAGIMMRFKTENIDQAPGYACFQMPTGKIGEKVTAIMDQKLTLNTPDFDEQPFFGKIMTTIQNMESSDLATLVSTIAKDAPFKKVITQLPGTSALLITNGYHIDNIYEDCEDIKVGQTTMPALMYLQFASFATKVKFSPNEMPTFVREVTDAIPMRLSTQVSNDATVNKDYTESANPIDIVVTSRVRVPTASLNFKVLDASPDLSSRATTEYTHGNEITIVVAPVMPEKSGDRKSQVSRPECKFSRVAYKSRSSKKQIYAPIDMESLFGRGMPIAVPQIMQPYPVEKRTKFALDVIAGLKAIDHSQHTVSLIEALGTAFSTAYSTLGVRRRNEIHGMAAQPTEVAVREYAIMSGLHTLKEVSKLTKLVDAKVIQEVIDLIVDLDDPRFYDLTREVALKAAKLM